MKNFGPNRASKIFGGATFFLFLAVLFFDFADQSLLSPLLNPLLSDFFGRMDDVVPMGWVSFVFTLFSALSMMAAGFFSDRYSRKKICLAGCLLYGTSSILTILTPHGGTGYCFFFITRALNGIGIGAVLPAVFSMVGDLVQPQRRSTAFGFISTSMLTGRMAGFIIAAAFLGTWRTAYLFIGMINICLAAGLLFFREPSRGSGEKELHDLITHGAEYNFRIGKKDLRLLWKNKSNFWLIANFIDMFPASIILFLVFKYMEDKHNMGGQTINILLIMIGVSGALGAIVFGRLGDWAFRRDKRAKALIALVCNALPIIFMLIFLKANFIIPEGSSLGGILAVPGVLPVIFFIAVAVFINQGVHPNWYSCLADINLPEHRGTIVSLASVMDMAGSALGPLIASYIASRWGIQAAMRSVLFFWILNIFLWLPVIYHIRGDLDRSVKIIKGRAVEMKREMP
ncbi:MAG: MFS transporter [Candidatus Aminicenantes bacterium]|nr:MFS transporter [Candidatus Aminicenantes bacterium]